MNSTPLSLEVDLGNVKSYNPAPPFDPSTHLTFGKHRGKAFRDVPPRYLLWLMDQRVNEDQDIGCFICEYCYVHMDRLADLAGYRKIPHRQKPNDDIPY